ncbi:ATP-binding protein [Streptomyces profundus]|nr:ATP-binding protein [Streptomyces sp. MA3_2.13]
MDRSHGVATPVASVAGTSMAEVRDARDLTRAFCARLTPTPPRDAVDAALLVVSELVTNALRHGGGRYLLELSATGATVRVAVSDGEPRPPKARGPDVLRGGGFGWPLVRSLSVEVGVRCHAKGKTVSAVLPRG